MLRKSSEGHVDYNQQYISVCKCLENFAPTSRTVSIKAGYNGDLIWVASSNRLKKIMKTLIRDFDKIIGILDNRMAMKRRNLFVTIS